MRLTIELVPSSCWYSNLRKKVATPVWDVIRKQAYKDAGYRCAICGATGKLFCHEVWQYDDDRYIQSLVGFIALCEMCHMVKHIGYAGIRAMNGELEYEDVVRHFIAVNGCSREDFEVHISSAFEVWERRSNYEWVCDLVKYKGLIPE